MALFLKFSVTADPLQSDNNSADPIPKILSTRSTTETYLICNNLY